MSGAGDLYGVSCLDGRQHFCLLKWQAIFFCPHQNTFPVWFQNRVGQERNLFKTGRKKWRQGHYSLKELGNQILGLQARSVKSCHHNCWSCQPALTHCPPPGTSPKRPQLPQKRQLLQDSNWVSLHGPVDVQILCFLNFPANSDLSMCSSISDWNWARHCGAPRHGSHSLSYISYFWGNSL